MESLWRNPKALFFFIEVHVDENNIEMSTSRPRKFKMWTRYVILLIRGTSVLERSMTMGGVLIKARTRNSGKVVYEYWFEVASIDGKRQWKSTDYSIYAFQKYNCSRKRKRTACILLTEIKMRLTNTTYMLYSVIDKRESEDYR